jgi:hypothetical protein
LNGLNDRARSKGNFFNHQPGGIMYMPRRLGAEFFGTFWLTFAGCGSAVLAAGFPTLGIGFLGVSFAFGLTVLTMALCGWPHLRRTFQLRGDDWALGRQPL